jgi:hypothetical protein
MPLPLIETGCENQASPFPEGRYEKNERYQRFRPGH